MTDPRGPRPGAPMHRGPRPMTLTFRGRSVAIEMPGWYGDESGESLHVGADMDVSDRALRRLKAPGRA